MKIRITALLLCLVMTLAFVGCAAADDMRYKTDGAKQGTKTQQEETGSKSEEKPEEQYGPKAEAVPEDQKDAQAGGSRALVVYFSRTGEQYRVGVIEKGNTAKVAEEIAEQTGADVFEVLPAEDNYPTAYEELTDYAKREQNENARPAYAGDVPELSGYDTVFIGAPVWWGDRPMIMYTFFEKNADALAGKTLYPFSTHEGSGLSGFDRKLASALAESTVGEGMAITGSDAQNDPDKVRSEVEIWLSDIEF